MEQQLKESIKKWKAESSTPLQLEKELRGKKVESLLEEKNGHMAECEMLLKEDQALCTDLCKTPYYIPTGKVPAPQELELKNHLISTAKEKSIKKEDGTGYKTPLKRTLTAASTSEENPKSQ